MSADQAPPPEEPAARPDFRFGFVAICGAPNVGKSTLLNAILGERLAIATPKPQTTRRRTLGILTTDACQMVFVDTPGILEPRYALQEAMMQQVDAALRDADLLLLVADARAPEIAPGVREAGRRKPLVVALNKADLLRTLEESLPAIERLQGEVPGAEFFVVSARQGGGLPALVARLGQLLPPGPPAYPPDELTEHPERFFVAEILREAVFTHFHQEVPYSTEVEIEDFRERPGAKDYIAATLFVESDTQKAILIGRGGAAVRALGETARREIEAFLGRPVFLALRVAVLPNWRRDPRALRRFGYGPRAT
jgi:GTP-binding protein Era